jgi:PhnB protein
MLSLNPYLNFNGNCTEAMKFYQDCFGGELILQKISESPMAVHLPSAAANHILHSVLQHHQFTLMASDMIGAQRMPGNTVTLCLNCSTKEEIESAFFNLGSGAVIKTPLHQTFWGATYGELTDKFGTLWIFNLSNNK